MRRDEGKAKGLGWDLARECDNTSFNVLLSVSDIWEAFGPRHAYLVCRSRILWL
jgi:hypothetical protein